MVNVASASFAVLSGCVGGNSALTLPPGGGYINSGALSSGININEPCMYRVTLEPGRRARFVIYDFTLRRYSGEKIKTKTSTIAIDVFLACEASQFRRPSCSMSLLLTGGSRGGGWEK